MSAILTEVLNEEPCILPCSRIFYPNRGYFKVGADEFIALNGLTHFKADRYTTVKLVKIYLDALLALLEKGSQEEELLESFRSFVMEDIGYWTIYTKNPDFICGDNETLYLHHYSAIYIPTSALTGHYAHALSRHSHNIKLNGGISALL